MEQIRRARGHVCRAGFKGRLEKTCAASADKIDVAMQSLGPSSSVKDVLRMPSVDRDVKDALTELMVFTSDVVGSDDNGCRVCNHLNQHGI